MKITAAVQEKLMQITQRPLGVLDLASPDLMGSAPAQLHVDAHTFTRAKSAAVEDAIAAAKQLATQHPLGQAHAVIDAGDKHLWIAAVSGVRIEDRPSSGSVPFAAPLNLTPDVAERDIEDPAKALVALVGPQAELRP